MTKSHLTAISRKTPSAPISRLDASNRLEGIKLLDYGCGKGTDADYYNMDKYDPHYFNDIDLQENTYDLITCTYVLNVIDCEDERQQVINDIEDLLKDGGKAFITVRRDVKSTGYTSRGTYQENIQLKLPILWENGQYCTYVIEKASFDTSDQDDQAHIDHLAWCFER